MYTTLQHLHCAQLSKSTTDYKAKLFERGLEDCVLEPMHIDTDASSGGSLSAAFSVAPMTPLFSLASQAASQLSDSSSSGHALASWGTLALDVSKRERGMLRATQDYKWTQTLAAGGDSSQAAESRIVFGTQADTTTAAAARAMAPPPPRRPRVGGRQTAVVAGGEGSQAAVGAVVAVAGPLGSQQQQLARRRRQRGAQQQRKVVLYRTYRKGELPDIEIQLQDILRPLQHLALRDRQTARLLFEKLFGGIFSSSSSNSSSSNSNSSSSSVQKQLATALQSVLGSAKHDTELVACLHAAYAEAVDATAAAAAGGGPAAAAAAAAAVPTLPPALVAESALRSLNCHSGALLLEQGLTRNAAVVAAAATAAGTGGASGGTTPRRASGSGRRTAAAAAQARADKAACSAAVQDGSSSSSSTDDQDAWLQLSRLYFELGDADMLVGLIARTVRVARTREALEAELSGDINRAVRLYNELENEHYEGVAGSEASVAELVSSTVVHYV
jgi:DNA-PKcs, CC5